MFFIFGYGSLISPIGINNRNMVRFYREDDLKEASLTGYRREWNTVWDGRKYLGIVPDPDCTVNGVLFPISPEDLVPFKESEGIGKTPPMYDLVDVTSHFFTYNEVGISPQHIVGELKHKIFTCVTCNPTTDGQVPDYYLDILNEGFIVRGTSFTKRFIKTTYPKGILKSRFGLKHW